MFNNHLKTPADVAEISTDRLVSLISKKLKEEAAQVARSLAFLDTLEDYAVQNMMVQDLGLNII